MDVMELFSEVVSLLMALIIYGAIIGGLLFVLFVMGAAAWDTITCFLDIGKWPREREERERMERDMRIAYLEAELGMDRDPLSLPPDPKRPTLGREAPRQDPGYTLIHPDGTPYGQRRR